MTSCVDVVLCHSEVNNRYGTGILIQRMFPGHRENVVSIRAVSVWQGEQEFGVRELVIPPGLNRAEIYAWTLAHTGDFSMRHIYCIPYAGEEILAALALRDAHRAPFCLYIMDDQNVASDEIPAIYASSDVYVCLSEHEGVCLPVVEAMQRGIPVVAAARAALSEIIGEGGILLEDKDPVAVASAVHRVTTDASLRHTIGDAARAQVVKLAAGEGAYVDTVRAVLAKGVHFDV